MKTILLLLSLSLCLGLSAQTGQWTWVSGDNTTNNAGVYGIKGTAAAANKPGERDRQSAWIDASGNFWFFAGSDHNTNYYNDLWKYNPTTGQWTWVSGNNTQNVSGTYGVKGVGAAANKPGSRNGQSAWIDAAGNFWVFGGYGYDGVGTLGRLNDLWKYNTLTGFWTWVSGSKTADVSGVYGTKGTAAAANVPGARRFQAAWVDGSGNFWIFGGYGFDVAGNQGSLNDLWKYNPVTGFWTWVSGSNSRNATGVYGTKGTAAAANTPGGRDSHSGWMDASGNFWVFGGWDWNNNTFNDLWMYNTASGQWTWKSGDNTQNNTGVYGTKGVTAAANKPGGRFGQAASIDEGGHFWIFGGQGYDNAGDLGMLNDLMEYDPVTGQWGWSSGDNTRNNTGVYGTKGTAAAVNKPGAGYYPSSLIDASGNLWAFAGQNSAGADFNSLMKFTSLIPLALQDISLSAKNQSGANILSWQTVGEINTLRFHVERSLDGRNFSAIGTLPAVGSGDNSYSFSDDNIPQGQTVYYRVGIEDSHGAFMYSTIVSLSGITSPDSRVYPNPAKSLVTLELGDYSLLNTTVRLFDISGKLIGTWQISSPQQVIDLSRAQRGICFLQLADGKTIKLLKE